MNGFIVANTGPIIALAIIDKLDILNALFDEVVVPEEVNNELLHGGTGCAGLASYQQSSWIKVLSLSNPIDPLLKTVLDIGEASVIQLARECGANSVLIDERKARKIARDIYGMHVVGSARVLVEAKRHGLIESVSEMINGIRSGGYWIHDDIVDFALRKAGEA
jgi:uncharacterized protein